MSVNGRKLMTEKRTFCLALGRVRRDVAVLLVFGRGPEKLKIMI
jgi:hypothetical protein